MKIGNWPLLLLVIEHVIKHPDEYDQVSYRNRYASCGTTRCIAGWLAYFAGWRDTDENPRDSQFGYFTVENRQGRIVSIERAALEALELDPEQFSGEYEHEDFAALLFSGELTFSEVLEVVRDLAKADGVTPTPLIIDEMLTRCIVTTRGVF